MEKNIPQKSFSIFFEQLVQCVVNYDGRGDRGASQERTMKARKQMYEGLDVHAEVYHRHKIEALRIEGERLRDELRRRGLDPTMVLLEAYQSRVEGHRTDERN